jgi:hypothetical protein
LIEFQAYGVGSAVWRVPFKSTKPALYFRTLRNDRSAIQVDIRVQNRDEWSTNGLTGLERRL